MSSPPHPPDTDTSAAVITEREINLHVSLDKLERRLTLDTIEARESLLKETEQAVELRVALDRAHRTYQKQINTLKEELRLERDRAAALEVDLRVRIDRLERKLNHNNVSIDNEQQLNEEVDLRVRLDRLERKLSRANTLTSSPAHATTPTHLTFAFDDHATNSDDNNTWDRPPMSSVTYGLETATRLWPDKIAIHYRDWKKPPKGQKVATVGAWHSCTYQEFFTRVHHIGQCFIEAGACAGDYVLMLWLPPNQMEALSLMFALMRERLAIVWLDPRTMTLSQIAQHVEHIAPKIVLATSLVSRMLRVIQVVGRRLRSVKIVVNPARFNRNRALVTPSEMNSPRHDVMREETALVVFTTGATGPPKPVCLTRSNLAAQVDAYQSLAQNYGLGKPGAVIAVHAGMNFNALDLALGNTTICLPDPSNPGNIPPAWICEIDSKFGPSVLTGSRIIWENLCGVHISKGIRHLRVGFSGGAPCTPGLHHEVCAAIPCLQELVSVYGCTEGLPLACAGSKHTWTKEKELRCERGDGIVLGMPCEGVQFRVLRLDVAINMDTTLDKEPKMQTWQDSWECTRGEIGELLVSSSSVSPRYVTKSMTPTNLTKILTSNLDSLWHRTGDLVVQDEGENGEIWMMGRMQQAVKLSRGVLVPPVCVESMFDGKLGVRRCAFVGIMPPAEQTAASGSSSMGNFPVLVVLMYENMACDKKALEMLVKGSRWEVPLRNMMILEWPNDEFPMDLRHASKIDRTYLSQWAEAKTGFVERER